jgi:hypothetical protein
MRAPETSDGAFDQLASLSANARVKQFVGVIATRRVKQHVRQLEAEAH